MEEIEEESSEGSSVGSTDEVGSDESVVEVSNVVANLLSKEASLDTN